MRNRYSLATLCLFLVLLTLSTAAAYGQVQAAARALNTPNRVARQAAVSVISSAAPDVLVDLAADSRSLVSDLVDLRSGGDEESAKLADEALKKMAPEAGDRLADAPDETKVELLDMLEEMGDAAKPALDKVVDELDADNPIVREEAADALGAIADEGDDEVVAALEKAESDPSEGVRASAGRALRRIRG